MFYPDEAPVPTTLRTEEFLLRPLRAADVDLDYEAVMATQEVLRRGSGGDVAAPRLHARGEPGRLARPRGGLPCAPRLHLHRNGPDRDPLPGVCLRLPA